MIKPHHRAYAAAFLLDGAVAVGFTVIPFFVFHQLNGGAAMSGTFGALQAIAYGTVCVTSSGFVTHARNGLNWALTGIAGFLVFLSLVPFFRVPALCAVLAMCAGGSLALVWPALHAWIGAEPDPRTRSRYMVWFNIAWSSGFVAGPLLAGPLCDFDYRAPFVLLAAMTLGAGLLVYSLPHEKEYFGLASEEMLKARADHDRASEGFLYAAWLAAFTASMLVNALRNVFPKQIDDLVSAGQLRLLAEATPPHLLTSAAATTFSWLAGALSLATAIMFLVLGLTQRWHHRFAYLFGLQALSALAFFMLAQTHSLIVMMACFSAVGASLGLAFFSGVYYSVANPVRKHARTALNEAAVGIGAFTGSMLLGLLAGRYGMALPFQLTPIFVGGSLLLQWALVRNGLSRVRSRACERIPSAPSESR